MNKTSTKHSNKNTIRSNTNSSNSSNSYRTINTSNAIGSYKPNNDHYLDDLLDDDETDKPAGKITSSQHDERIKAKSKAMPTSTLTTTATSRPSSSGQSLHKLVTDGQGSQRISKAVRQTKGSKATSSTTSKQQRTMPVQQIMGAVHPLNMNCDKIVLNAYMSTQEREVAVERAQQLVKQQTLVKSTSKQKHYRHVFKLPFESGAYAMLLMTPTKANMKAQVQLSFNPNPSHMNKANARLMVKIWKSVFGLNAQAIASAMLFHRIDICADFERLIDDLIIDLDGVLVGTRFGITTAKGGSIKSIYMGGEESKHHGVAYDQVASDKYKASVGEVTSRRRSLRSDADIAFDATEQGLRIESRRLFKEPINLTELGKVTDIFGGYKVWDVRPRAGIRMSPEFVNYLDCVRLRGFNGARKWALDNSADKQAAKALISVHEKTLRRLAADWWRPQDFNATLLEVLQQSPAWLFLKVLAY